MIMLGIGTKEQIPFLATASAHIWNCSALADIYAILSYFLIHCAESKILEFN